MPTQTILDNEFATVRCLPEKKIVHFEIHKFTCGDELRKALLAGTETLMKFGAHKWLSDDRAQSAIPQEDLGWCDSVWFPKTLQAGWKVWALVLPENIMGQMNLKRVLKTYAERGITAQFFSDPYAAMQWLERQ
jgi:hypothetical protein